MIMKGCNKNCLNTTRATNQRIRPNNRVDFIYFNKKNRINSCARFSQFRRRNRRNKQTNFVQMSGSVLKRGTRQAASLKCTKCLFRWFRNDQVGRCVYRSPYVYRLSLTVRCPGVRLVVHAIISPSQRRVHRNGREPPPSITYGSVFVGQLVSRS